MEDMALQRLFTIPSLNRTMRSQCTCALRTHYTRIAARRRCAPGRPTRPLWRFTTPHFPPETLLHARSAASPAALPVPLCPQCLSGGAVGRSRLPTPDPRLITHFYAPPARAIAAPGGSYTHPRIFTLLTLFGDHLRATHLPCARSPLPRPTAGTVPGLPCGSVAGFGRSVVPCAHCPRRSPGVATPLSCAARRPEQDRLPPPPPRAHLYLLLPLHPLSRRASDCLHPNLPHLVGQPGARTKYLVVSSKKRRPPLVLSERLHSPAGAAIAAHPCPSVAKAVAVTLHTPRSHPPRPFPAPGP